MNDISVIQNIKMVETDPYPYVYTDQALPEKIYKELCDTFPEDIVTSTVPHDDGKCYRYKSNEALGNKNLSQIWQDFFGYHTSKEYFNSCIDLFAKNIEKIYGSRFVDQLKAGVKTVRGVDNSGQLVTDCQFVVHEPVDQSGTTRTPHLDNPVEIYAGLLYMKKPNDTSKGGNFTVYEQIKEITQVNKTLGRQVPDGSYKPVKEVPYKQNSFAMFLNVKNSIHGVTPRINPLERRRSINIIGEFNRTGKMWNIKEIKTK